MKKSSSKNSNRKFLKSLTAKRNETRQNLANKLKIERRLRNFEIIKNTQENYEHREKLLNEFNQSLKEESKKKDRTYKVIVIALTFILTCAFFLFNH